jgi:hypothetical protein
MMDSRFTVKKEKKSGLKTNMISMIVKKIANTPYARKAVEEKADLSAFKQRPTVRILLGVFMIGFSYVIGWPAVSALTGLAVYLQEPLVVIIGGPLTYGLSHLVFMAGMYLAGAKYSAIFMRWATRMLVEKMTGKRA